MPRGIARRWVPLVGGTDPRSHGAPSPSHPQRGPHSSIYVPGRLCFRAGQQLWESRQGVLPRDCQGTHWGPGLQPHSPSASPQIMAALEANPTARRTQLQHKFEQVVALMEDNIYECYSEA